MAKTTKNLPSWRVTLLRKKGERIGTVVAASADEAIEVAVREYNITDPERQRRLVAQRVAS